MFDKKRKASLFVGGQRPFHDEQKRLIENILKTGKPIVIAARDIKRCANNSYPVIWLTGQSGAGKTSIARMLKDRIGGVVLDGDEMRQSISNDLGFSKKDRTAHNLRIAKLAKILARDTKVIVSLITPYEDLRAMVSKIVNPIWVYVERKVEISNKKPFEIPHYYHVKVNSNKQTIKEQVEIIINYLIKD